MNPTSVLDIGMFLMRMGAISRGLGDIQLSNKIVMDAVDYLDKRFPIYNSVYNKIYTDTLPDNMYDMIIAFCVSGIIDEGNIEELWNYATNHSRVFLTDYSEEATRHFYSYDNNTQIINVSGRNYVMIVNEC
jgi:hypothetical protein